MLHQKVQQDTSYVAEQTIMPTFERTALNRAAPRSRL